MAILKVADAGWLSPQTGADGGAVAEPDLARDTADLLSITDKSSSRSLNELVGLAARQVRACSGAAAALWRDGEPVLVAASHPDVCELVDVTVTSRRGPELAALSSGSAAGCADTLAERRWPEYAHAALCRGVRCCVAMAHASGGAAVTLSLFSARPRVLDPDQIPLAELLVAAGGAAIGNMSSYGDARRMALQLNEAAAARALVDQATGILMYALGCSAEHAFQRMRELSRERNMKVTEVARKIIDSEPAPAG
jgi:ANTAR domain-containing protein